MAKQFLSVLFRLLSAIILSRLLPPAVFGLVAMVAFFRGLMDMLSASGFVDASIQKKHLSLEDLTNVFWINAISSFVLAGIFVACGPLIAGFYGQPELVPICLVIGLLFVLENIFRTHDGILRRCMLAEIHFVIFLVPQFVNLVASVGMAFLGFDVWALVGGMVFSAISARLMYLYYVRWSPGKLTRTDGVAELTRYGLRAMFGSVVGYLSQYSQNVALGKFATVSEVGFYNRGQTIFMMPLMKVSEPVAQMMLPALASLQGNRVQLLNLMHRASWLVILITMPFAVFTVVYGDWLIPFLLGKQWEASGEVARWLALASIPVLMTNLFGRANAAIGRPGRGIGVSLAGLPFLLGGVIHFSPDGAVAVAKFFALYRFVMYLPNMTIQMKGSGFDIRKVLISQMQLLALAIFVGMTLWMFRYLQEGVGANAYSIASIISAVGAYALYLLGYRFSAVGKSVLIWLYEKFGERLHLPRIFFVA